MVVLDKRVSERIFEVYIYNDFIHKNLLFTPLCSSLTKHIWIYYTTTTTTSHFFYIIHSSLPFHLFLYSKWFFKLDFLLNTEGEISFLLYIDVVGRMKISYVKTYNLVMDCFNLSLCVLLSRLLLYHLCHIGFDIIMLWNKSKETKNIKNVYSYYPTPRPESSTWRHL